MNVRSPRSAVAATLHPAVFIHPAIIARYAVDDSITDEELWTGAVNARSAALIRTRLATGDNLTGGQRRNDARALRDAEEYERVAAFHLSGEASPQPRPAALSLAVAPHLR